MWRRFEKLKLESLIVGGTGCSLPTEVQFEEQRHGDGACVMADWGCSRLISVRAAPATQKPLQAAWLHFGVFFLHSSQIPVLCL